MALRHVTAEDITRQADTLGRRADARCMGTVTMRGTRVVSASATSDCADALDALTTHCDYWDLDAEDFSEAVQA